MATPNPDAGTEWITISDFSAGIHSDLHSAVAPRYTAADLTAGGLIGNGLAQVEGTARCHADKAGSLIPLPKAVASGFRDTIRPHILANESRPYRYVLDAQIGNTLVDNTETASSPFAQASRTLLQIMWGYDVETLIGAQSMVIGREYRLWLDFPDDYSVTTPPIIDFLIGLVEGDSSAYSPLPVGSLARARFYYGATAAGIAEATAVGTQNLFHPLWTYAVSVALAATPWVRWGNGNRFQLDDSLSVAHLSYYGIAVDPASPLWSTSPAIGWKGEGTAIVAMQLADNGVLNLPFPTIIDRWFHHYSERYVTPQTNTQADIAEGMLNPYLLVAHQGRIVIPDRRRTAGGFAGSSAGADHGYLDDMLFYSDYALPTQDFVEPPLATQAGVANAAYGEFPQATMEPYNKLLVAEDLIAAFGTIGVVTVDQLLLVKHFGGGALVSGDLDNPTIHRLPYIEPTGGVTCKGVHTPVGFVYGSPNGIFVWQGGETTQRLSPQLDGFFWDHTDASTAEDYAGSRGRMGYWNSLVLVPNNYVYDIDTESWWRFATPTLDPVEPNTEAPFNCYDVDEENTLYAWPYRHIAEQYTSYVDFPSSSTGLNCLSISDPFGAVTELDIRFIIEPQGGTGSVRIIASHGGTAGDIAWQLGLDATDHLTFLTSTDGTATTTVTCDDPLNGLFFGSALGRVTWRASDGRVQFFDKPLGSHEFQLETSNGYRQLGANETASAAALFNSTDELVLGNKGNAALSSPFIGRFHDFWIDTAIDGTTPVVEVLSTDIPEDTTATSFPCSTGQTVTVTRAAMPALPLTLEWFDPTPPPCWYTFDADVLDDAYSWRSQPLVETRDRSRVTEFRSIELLTTGTTLSGDPSQVAVVLTGYDTNGAALTSETVIFTLANVDVPQLLRKDIAFQAQYVEVSIVAASLTGGPAPKIHYIRFATIKGATTRRSG